MSMTKMSAEEYRATSYEIYENIMSDNDEYVKTAAADLTNFIRRDVKEGSFRDSFVTPVPLKDEEIQQAMDHDDPMILVSLEPDSPGAKQVDYGSPGKDVYVYGHKVPLTMKQYQTDQVVKLLMQLRTYKYDFRQVIGDNMTKALIALKDVAWINACNAMMVAPETTIHHAGRPLWRQFGSVLTYASFLDSRKILDSGPYHLPNRTVLMNHHMIYEFKKMITSYQRGTEIANEIFTRGWTKGEFDGLQIVATIKDHLVPNGSMFFFPPEEYLGTCRILAEPTMIVKREGQTVSFREYMIEGCLIAHAAGVGRVDYAY